MSVKTRTLNSIKVQFLQGTYPGKKALKIYKLFQTLEEFVVC